MFPARALHLSDHHHNYDDDHDDHDDDNYDKDDDGDDCQKRLILKEIT